MVNTIAISTLKLTAILTIRERMRIKPNSSGSSHGKQGVVLQAIVSAARRRPESSGKSCGEHRGGSCGFTLLEVMVVMIIMAIMAAVAIPAFSSWREKQAVRSATQALMNQLKQARVLALAENRDVVINVCDGTVANAWVFDVSAPTAKCDPCLDATIPSSNPPQACTQNRYNFSQFANNLSVTVNRTPAKVTFTSRGSVKQTATITVATPSYNKAITLNIIGRAYLQ